MGNETLVLLQVGLCYNGCNELFRPYIPKKIGAWSKRPMSGGVKRAVKFL